MSAVGGRLPRRVAFAAGAWLVGVTLAHPASFDCGKSATAMERAICGDPAASAADANMARLYKAALFRLSPAGRALLRDSQRSFLRYAADLCRPGALPLDAADRTWRFDRASPPSHAAVVAQCLADVFEKRDEVLGRAVTPLGGRLFLTTTRYRVRPAGPLTLSGPDAVTEIKTLVQIDTPRNGAEMDWNRVMAALIEKVARRGLVDTLSIDESDTDVGVQMRVVSASPDLIVTQIDLSNYDKGRPHGRFARWCQNWSLRLGRLLTKHDIFDPAKPWSTVLATVANDRFGGSSGARPETPITEIADSQDQWAFTSQGLRIGYDPYMLGDYGSAGETLIPWTALAPFLRDPLPFDQRALAEPADR